LKTALKWLRNHCANFEFDNRDIYEIEIYYNILLAMDQQKTVALANTVSVTPGTAMNGVTTTAPPVVQKEIGLNILQRKAVLAIFIFLKSMKIADDDPEYTLKEICNRTIVSYEEVNELINKIKKDPFKDKDKIADILFKQDLLTFAETYSKKANLSENDQKGYIALC